MTKTFAYSVAVSFAMSVMGCFVPTLVDAQVNVALHFDTNIPVVAFTRPDLTAVHQEDKIRDNNGEVYRFAIGTEVNITTQNSGLWTSNSKGDKIWQLIVKYPGAQALSFYFAKFQLYGNATIDVYNAQRERLHLTYTAKDVLSHGQQNLALCRGDYMLIELVEPKGTPSSVLEMEGISYAYRSIGQSIEKGFKDSDNCEININCSEGDDWQDEKRGVARILLSLGFWSQGWCSGSLVNNTLQDCQPYFLTAMHCITNMSVSNLNNTRFYFNYESKGCTTPSSESGFASEYITGCSKLATSDDVNVEIINQSDFALLYLGPNNDANGSQTVAKLKKFNAYWNGWDANNVAPDKGVCIHHPQGDIKKISTYTTTAISSSWSNPSSTTHWRLQFVTTANGHGVTEGGSSGSPLFVYNGGNSRIVGTLSGGSDACDNFSGVSKYGKVSYHWQSVGSTTSKQLKPWLAPNSDVKTLNGSYVPCEVPPPPTPDFNTNKMLIQPGELVKFTDLSQGYPHAWTWSISPSSGWSYTDGTSSSSKNPKIVFNSIGFYTVSLTVTNASGTASTTRLNYIVVHNNLSTTHCSATSQECDEYIARVELNTLDNASGCEKYHDYTDKFTALNVGENYQAKVTTQIVGYALGSGYNNDKVAIWIDWNNNGEFTDPGEYIGLWNFSVGYAGGFPFTVPTNMSSGVVTMRVRLEYIDDEREISPCGSSEYGEVEDYSLVIINPNDIITNSLHDQSIDFTSIYPNPAQDNITVAFTSNIETVSVELLDLSGKKVLQSSGSNVDKMNIDISSLAMGMYQVVVRSSQGQKTERIIKK